MAKLKNDTEHTTSAAFLAKRLGEGGFILVFALVLFILLALATWSPHDPSWFHTGKIGIPVHNACGKVGASIATALFFLFGTFGFVLPLSGVYIAWITLQEYRLSGYFNQAAFGLRLSGLLLFLVAGSSLLGLQINEAHEATHAGGVLGDWFANSAILLFNQEGACLLFCSLLLVGITWFTGVSWLFLMEWMGALTLKFIRAMTAFGKTQIARFSKINATTIKTELPTEPSKKPSLPFIAKTVKKEKPLLPEAPLVSEISSPPIKEKPPRESLMQTSRRLESIQGVPELSLLDKGTPGKPMGGFTHQELETLSRDVEQHLLDFGIQADVVAVHPGPVITRFELQLAAGVKVSRLSALSRDLARALSVIAVRVVEVIPGKTVVGLELPNQHRQTVRLSEVLSQDACQQAVSPLTLVLGVDIAGHPMIVDLAKMPHLLVAGTTGSGKSVGINAMILSLLFRATPEQVRLILIDPKMLELSVYDGIPHLLTPVVTDMKEAASALRWCVAEMERRYRLMSQVGVRNLQGYNTKVMEESQKGTPLKDPFWPQDLEAGEAPLLQTLPYVVVIIDELADMMMVVGKKVEQLIARIAQKARAAGIHLILATQRPSVDVLTGLIKSNIPTRISFQVSSKIDSRTILDQQGAEQLLGHGDMLYLAPGTGAPLRVHGAFVEDGEVHRVASAWRQRGEPDYIHEITSISENGEFDGGGATEDKDSLYDEVVEFVIQTRKASISAVQRRFKIGYNRAARLVEEMERCGILGPQDGGVRDVLISSHEEHTLRE